MMKRLILGIFISFGFVFLMSYNSYAIDLNIPVTTLWANFPAQWYYLSNTYGAGISGTSCVSGYGCWNVGSPNNSWTSILNTDNIRQFRFSLPDGLILKPGDFIETELFIRNNDANNALDFRLGPMNSRGSRASLLQMETVRSTNNQSQVRFLFVVEGNSDWLSNGRVIFVGSSRCADCNIMWASEPDTEVTGGIVNIYRRSTDVNYSQDLRDLKNGVTNLGNKIDNLNKDVEDKTEQESQNAQNQGDNSSQSATNATTGLINAIGGFVGAITTASPSNCIINGNMGNFNMGNIDLCANPVPSFVQIISSLILIVICIPFAIIMFNRFIGLFRSFQG